MIRILYGNAGSGKTQRIYELMKNDAVFQKQSYLLVPEQQTVQCERLMLDMLLPSSQLTTSVLNFSCLADLVFRNYGGLSYNYADKGSKTLIMWKNLKELAPILNDFPSISGNFGTSFAKEMLALVSEMKAYCISPTKLEKASEKITESPILKSKMLNLSLIMQSYTNNLLESYSDSSDDLTKLAEKLKTHDFFHGCNVYIDSFTGFTTQEYEVIEQIIKGAAEVTFALTLDKISSSQIHYESTAETAMKIIQMAQKSNIKILEEHFGDNRNVIMPLRTIANSLWNPNVTDIKIPKENNNAIEIIETSDPYEESVAAANEVKKLMMQGVRCKDIVIVARDASLYKGIIDIALEKSEIPYFFSQRTDIMSKAPIKFIISALRIKIYNWRREDVIAYLKTNLCGFDFHSIDLFECYTNLWNIRGSKFIKDDFTMNPNGYSEIFTDRSKEILREVNELKNNFVPPLMKFFTELDSAKNGKELCIAVYNFLEANHIRDVLEESANSEYRLGKRKEAAELIQLYNAEIKALENLSTILGDDDISIKEFTDSLKIMLDESYVNTIPTAKDQVTVGSASMLRVGNVKCAILLGVNEGEFPQTVREVGLFSDNDKKILNSVGISLSADSFTKSSDELFYVYKSMSMPSEKLIMLYHCSDFKGSKTNYSMAISRLIKIFPDLKIRKYCDFEPSETILSIKIAKENLCKIKDDRYSLAITKYLKEINEASFNYKANVENKFCNLSKETSSNVYKNVINLTQTVIEQYVSCPFGYMCSRLFNINDIEKATFEYMNFGTYVHYILENYLRQAKIDNMIGKDPDEKYIKSAVDNFAFEYFKKISSDDTADNNRLQHRFMRMRKLACLVATSITREFSDSKFTPEFFELPIGRKGNSDIMLSPIVFDADNNKKVSLSGIADRVDACTIGDDVYIKVVDYKTGEKTFSKSDIQKGEGLQLPLYLFSLCDDKQTTLKKALGNPKGKILPAGAMYISSKIDPIEVFGEKDEHIYLKAENAIKHSGFLINDENILRNISQNMSSQYLCGIKMLKNGNLSGSALMSTDEMEQMSIELRDKIISIANSMAEGNMSTSPSQNACEHCKFKNICRNSAPKIKTF